MSDDLLPSNASPMERAMSGAGDRMLDADTDAIRRLRRPADCSAQFVPFLCWERSVRLYDPNNAAWNRARAQNAFEEHLTVGTPPVQEAEIAFDTGQNVHLVEFWEERDLAWPDFVIESVINPGDPAPDLDALIASTLRRKNVRDIPKVRTRVVQPPATRYAGAGHRVGIAIRNTTTTQPLPAVGATHRLMPQVRINPR